MGPVEAAQAALAAQAVQVAPALFRTILMSLGMAMGMVAAEAVAMDRPAEAATGPLVAVAMSRQAAVETDARRQDVLAGHGGAPPVEGVATRVTAATAVPMSPVGWPSTTSGTSCKNLR